MATVGIKRLNGFYTTQPTNQWRYKVCSVAGNKTVEHSDAVDYTTASMSGLITMVQSKTVSSRAVLVVKI